MNPETGRKFEEIVSKVALHEYLDEIQHLLDEEMYDDAAGHCRSILQQYPRHVDSYRLLAQALLEQGEYRAAEDVYQRIMSVSPNDLTVHIGISLVAQEEENLNKAIWHMQQAYELEPYNASLQIELKKLYKKRDGRAPAKLILTQGALAHLHFRSEMYQTAVSEYRAMLKKEPNRLGLKVMLAEAYWRQGDRVNAMELSRRILEETPNCIQANAIIVEISLLTGRLKEVQPYLELLQALTQASEATLDRETAVGRAFSVNGAPALPRQIMVERDGRGGEAIGVDASVVSSAEWLSEVDIDASKADGQIKTPPVEVHDSTGWLTDMGAESEADDEGTFADFSEALDEAPAFEELFAEQDDDEGWFDSLTETDADTLEDAGSISGNDTGDIFGTDGSDNAPDWMGDGEVDSSGDTLDWFAEEETSGAVADDELDWLGELDGDDNDDTLLADDFFGDVPPSSSELLIPEPSDSDTSDDDDDLFGGLGLSGLLVGTAAAGAAAILHDGEKEDADESLDWLADDLEPLTEGTYTAADDADDANDLFGGPGLTAMLMGDEISGNSPAADDADDVPDWLAGGTSEPADESAPEADLPDWLGGGDDDTETAVDDTDLPDWLSQSEDADAPAPVDDLPDWLAGGVDEQVESSSDDSLPDWLAGSVEDDDDSSLTGIVAAGAVLGGVAIAAATHDDDNDDDDFADWLGDDLDALTDQDSENANDADLDEAEDLFGGPGLTAMLLGDELDNAVQPDDDIEELPDWLSDDLGEFVDEPAVDIMPTDSDADSIDWLTDDAGEVADVTDDDLPDWLSGNVNEDDDAGDNTLATDIVAAGAVIGGAAIVAATHDQDDETQEEREDVMMNNDDKNEAGLPDDLFDDMPENQDDALEWLDQLADEQELEAFDDIPAEKGQTAVASVSEDDLPDWLQDSPDPMGALDIDLLEEDEPAIVTATGDLPDWLKDVAPDDAIMTDDLNVDEDQSYASRVAAGEGDVFDEMPTQVSATDPFDSSEDTSEFDAVFADIDDEDGVDFGDDDLDALFADTDDVTEDADAAAMLGLTGAAAIAAFDEDEEVEDDALDFLEINAADDGFGDLFDDLDGADDPLADFDMPEESAAEISMEIAEDDPLGFLEADTDGDGLSDLFDDLGDVEDPLAGFDTPEEDVAEVSMEISEDDPLGFLDADTDDDGFGDLFDNLDDADDPLADFDMPEEDAAEVSMEIAEDDPLGFLDADTDDDFADLFGDMDEVDDPMADLGLMEEATSDVSAAVVVDDAPDDEKEKFDSAGALAASALARALSKRNKKKEFVAPPEELEIDVTEEETAVSITALDEEDDPLSFLEEGTDDDLGDWMTDVEDMGGDGLDDLFADADAVEDPLAALAALEKEAAVTMPTFSEESDIDLDDLLADADGSLDFLDDELSDEAIGDLFADTDASITALEEEGINEDIFAEAGMGDSITDSEIIDLDEGLDWLDDSITGTGELTAFDWMEDKDTSILAEAPLISADDAVDDQITWLDELAAHEDESDEEEFDAADVALVAGGIAAGAVVVDLLSDESVDDDAEIDDAMSWLDDFSDDDSEPVEQLPSIADVVDQEPDDVVDAYATPFFSDVEDELADDTIDALEFGDVSQPIEELDSETAVNIDDLLSDDIDDVDDAMSWLDDLEGDSVADEVETAVDTPSPTIEVEEQAEPVTAAVAAIETTDTELDDDLDDAMAWLDDLEDDEPAAIEVEDVAAVVAVAGAAALVADKMSDDADDESADEEEAPAAPTRLSRALDWLESLAVTEGVVLSETAVDIDVSDDDLAQALEGLDALTAEPVVTSDETRDDELWVERSDPELEAEPKEMRYYDDGTPVPEDAVETSEGFVVWRRDDEEDAVELDFDLDFSDELAMFDDFDEEDMAETAVDTPAPEPKEMRYYDDGTPVPEDAVETSEGFVVWKRDDEEDAVELDFDLDFSDELAMFDGFDEEDMAETAVDTPVPEPKEMRYYDDGTPVPEDAVETSEGFVVWRRDDEEDAVDLDFDFDIPEDPDEMAAWLLGDSDEDGGTDPKVSAPTATESGEELQAQQTDIADNVAPPSFNIDLDDGVPVALPEDPDAAVAWLDVAVDEQEPNEFAAYDTSPIDDILGDVDTPAGESDEPLFGEEMGLGHDLSDSMPEWLSFTGGSNEADWLSALPEADVSGWLEAEGDAADSIDSDWAAVNAPQSRSRENKISAKSPRPQQHSIHTDDLHLPETSMLSTGYNLDGEKLRNARHLVNNGDTQASLSAYRSLIREGDGLNVIISDLEVATQKFKNEPEICHLLGDAYTQNGQLQKALNIYRDALGMM